MRSRCCWSDRDLLAPGDSHDRLVAGCRARARPARLRSRRPGAAATWPTRRPCYFIATMAIALLVGLWAWAWRSPPRMGKLMFWWPALLLAADLPTPIPTRARLHDRAGDARLRLHRVRPDGALVPDREAPSRPPRLGLHLHPRLPRPGDPERRQRALSTTRAAARSACRARRRCCTWAGALLAADVERRVDGLHHGHPPDRDLPAVARLPAGERRYPAVDRPGRPDRHVHHVHVLGLQLRPPHGQPGRRSLRFRGCRPPATSPPR